jgi:RimJ/RimL family protein N-acetyltransferase
MQRSNSFGQAIGAPVPDWSARPYQTRTMQGQYCRLEPINPAEHADALFKAYAQAPNGSDWTYMVAEAFTDAGEYRAYAERMAASTDPLHYAVIDLRSGQAVGTMSHMRIDPANGVVEVGHVMFSPLLKRTPISTEAQFLMMQHAFDTQGYRRYEWKCDALNAPSIQAATRLGFTAEGIFRQALVYKGRNRDTAWFSIIDSEWPALRSAFQSWLAPSNFDSAGQQRSTLAAGRGPVEG